MIELELNGMSYYLPTSFGDITIDKYMRLVNIDEDLSELNKNVGIISILTGIDVDTILELKMDNLKMMINELTFLSDKRDSVLAQKVKIEGKWYGFHQELDTMTIGQHIDLESFSGKDANEKLDYLMAVLYRPIRSDKKSKNILKFIKSYIYNKEEKINIEDYDIETLKERASLFKKHMKMDVVLGALFFFSILSVIYLESIENSIPKRQMERRMLMMMAEMGMTFSPNGDG